MNSILDLDRTKSRPRLNNPRALAAVFMGYGLRVDVSDEARGVHAFFVVLHSIANESTSFVLKLF